ncbi:hypothetical protein P3X46_006834 [Hevea brasiliensis]|uniref:Dynein light chain n=1 Tax=Hevea brasiliensis TaxID=3981 RepID=A0ABQ9MVD0_HEVBR|nr:dynein light chain 1, cytoplasmic [Hevea brasiliensis]KAJ9182890.1 hypothetical protein P3X46_006834 [Hevea brasiliensis]
MEMSRRCKEKQSSERRVIAGEAKTMIHDRIPTEEVMKLAAIAISLNVRPRSSDMPLHMQERAFRYARSFLDSAPKHRPNPTHLARALKKEFDSAYGLAWHCVVGTSFGSFVTHSAGGFVYFCIEPLSILLFKTEVELVTELEA